MRPYAELMPTATYPLPLLPDPDRMVGGRLVPSPIDATYTPTDGSPTLTMTIEVIGGVPRCTRIALQMEMGGREIMSADLRAISVADLVEVLAARYSVPVEDLGGGKYRATYAPNPADTRAGVHAVRKAREGSRRPLTDAKKRRVATIYNAEESHGLEAVQDALGVSRSTAARYISAAREAGYIEPRRNHE